VRRRPSEIVRLLKAAGAEVAEVPVLRSETLPVTGDLRGRLDAADWLVFTSPGALEALLEQLGTLGSDIRALGAGRIAAAGPATAAQLRRCGLRVDYAPETTTGFADGFPASSHATALLIGEEVGERRMLRDLAAAGLCCSELPVSRLTVDDRAPLPPIEQFDAIALASSNTARRLVEAYPDGPTDAQVVISIGPMTSRTAGRLGLRVDAEAAGASPAAVVRTLVERLETRPPGD
jgi:uroporphyrinogen-III synthase